MFDTQIFLLDLMKRLYIKKIFSCALYDMVYVSTFSLERV